MRFKPDFDIFQHGQPREQGKALKNHAYRHRPPLHAARKIHFAFGGHHQPRDGAQQGGLARAGATQQADYFVLIERQCHVIQHQALFAAFAVHMSDFLNVYQATRFDSHHDGALLNQNHTRLRRRSANPYSGRHSNRLNAMTKIDMTTMPNATRGKSPA